MDLECRPGKVSTLFISLCLSAAAMHAENYRSVLAEFSLWVCSCKCSGPLCEACRDLILFGLISPETCLQSLPTLPFASHDHGSGQLLNTGVSSLRLSDGSSIALDTPATRERCVRRVPHLQFKITRHIILAVLILICPLISERVKSDDYFLHSTHLCGYSALVGKAWVLVTQQVPSWPAMAT